MRPGDDAKEDHEHVREGTACAFAALDLKGGKRPLEAAERRAEGDFARLVVDSPSTRSKAALYFAFAPEKAFRVAQRPELRFTPRHGSWLNAVEMELSAAKSQRLARRAAGLEELRREPGAWQDERNARNVRVRWTFDVPDARAKLGRVYPQKEA